MSAFRHERSESSDTISSNGSSYQLILDHILSYPGSYEIPLRTMYTLNCAPRASTSHGRTSPSSNASSSPMTPQGGFQDEQATQIFSNNLLAQLSQLPNQPTSLPPSFITSFVRRCFPANLVDVDFPQALTGLDYLKDLETRRRREVAAAMSRLNIDRNTLGSDADTLSFKYPGVAQWVKSIEEKERKIDALYTQLYVGLRRWILINELSLLPFNKHNCVAMLNTLYPPVASSQPTSQLTPTILKAQRDGFFKYIQSVEKNGTRVLTTLMQQGRNPSEGNGWEAVTRTLGKYLQLANSIINECEGVCDVRSVSPQKSSDAVSVKQPRKVDSGVSFNVTESLNSRSNSIAEPASPTENSRPRTSVSKHSEPSRSRAPSNAAKHGTALERFARGLKAIGKTRTDATEMISDETSTPLPPNKSLRKMKSMGTLDSRDGSVSSIRNQPAPAYDGNDMRLQRTKYQAGIVAAQKGRGQSHEV